MTAPLIQGASGIEGEKLTYASTNENNKEIYTFTANEPVTWSISGGEKSLFSIEQDTGKLSFKDVPDYETIKNLNGTTSKVSKKFIRNFKGNIINIHPSLLPKYKGLNTFNRVLSDGEKNTGCTVHFVDEKLDSGKIIVKKRVKLV